MICHFYGNLKLKFFCGGGEKSLKLDLRRGHIIIAGNTIHMIKKIALENTECNSNEAVVFFVCYD